MSLLSTGIIFIVFLSRFQFTATVFTVAQLYKTGLSPSVKPIETTVMKKVSHCVIECAKTVSCYALSFGNSECLLFDAKYNTDDKDVLTTKPGYEYYHLNTKPEATEFEVVGTELTFDEALLECRKRKQGNLAIITDQKTQDRLSGVIKNRKGGHWLGMNGTVNGDGKTRASNFDLRWVDGQIFAFNRFNNFLDIMPQLDGRSCVAAARDGFSKGINHGYQWGDFSCTSKFPFVCQYSS